MTFNQFKSHLENLTDLNITLFDGRNVAPHFHLTELGITERTTVDCGGTLRSERRVVLQLWEANDTAHRLSPQKLLTIANKIQQQLTIGDEELEVEYQNETIGRYAITATASGFELAPLHTDCLASDVCGVTKPAKEEASCCGGGGCC
ncbi:MAG: hypothetical protein H6608_01275 [Flavobacteriales bacterium]|nr:hypothetical protein [Bacteroidota bacterium]MCB9239738.1 hypothetical protein [Flavobacteriales bacterium]